MIVGASHCDFADPGNPLCSWVCEGTTDPARTQLIQKYMTAWFNYYLQLETGNYGYLYGAQADADIVAGCIERQVDTAPRDLMTRSSVEAVALEWELYEHPIVAGYNVYRMSFIRRRLPGGTFTEPPHAQVGRTSAYVDTGLLAGQVYSYALRSCDPSGFLHESSIEVGAVPLEGASWIYLPIVLRATDLEPPTG